MSKKKNLTTEETFALAIESHQKNNLQVAENLYKEALALATSEANASREKARREIDSQRDEALNQLKSEADNLGNLIVERLLAKK